MTSLPPEFQLGFVKRAFEGSEITSLLKNIIGQNPKINHQKISDSLILLQINQLLGKLLPELLLEHVQIARYHKGVLYVHADHGIYAQQIQFSTREILEKIHSNGITDVEKIDVKVGRLSPNAHKTGDIMSRDQKMALESPENGFQHENSDQLDKLMRDIKELKK